MIKVEVDTIKINLDKQFYDLGAVKESLKEFNRVCNGKITIKKNIEIVLKPKEKSLTNILGYEFCNYVLGLMKNKTLV